VYGASDTPPGGAFTQVQARFQRKIGRGTRLVIGHSLGSVIAYEALCRLRHGVRSFVTVGSPIATPRLILEPLRRRQRRMLGAADDARFAWPGVARWTNVFAAADVWCVPVLRLAPVFDPRIRDVAVTHGSTLAPSASHALPQYLHHREVAEELARSLAESATDAERGPASTAA
jgi:pimeloyl-ACP methyl ester carboxylesterase